jgi:hypothetical protein
VFWHRTRTSQAAFASLCGLSPVPAFSGKTQRHRLNRGGDRQANRALYLIALSRTIHDPRTRAYLQRRTHQGRTKREILRRLKRYIARELYKPRPPRRTISQQLLDEYRSIPQGRCVEVLGHLRILRTGVSSHPSAARRVHPIGLPSWSLGHVVSLSLYTQAVQRSQAGRVRFSLASAKISPSRLIQLAVIDSAVTWSSIKMRPGPGLRQDLGSDEYC